jgi:hypothetical protein
LYSSSSSEAESSSKTQGVQEVEDDDIIILDADMVGVFAPLTGTFAQRLKQRKQRDAAGATTSTAAAAAASTTSSGSSASQMLVEIEDD